MRKKITAILPLYLAGVILLAFAVFPHHHHDSFICFNAIHCETADTQDEIPHHHSESSEKGHCIQYLFQTDHVKTFSRNLSDQGEDLLSHHFTFICCTLTEVLSISFLAHAPDLLPDAGDDILRQLLLSSHKFTRGPPRKG